MKINADFFKNLNPNRKAKKYKLDKTQKKALTMSSVALVLAGFLGISSLVGCGNQKNDTNANIDNALVGGTTVSDNVNPTDEEEVVAVEEDEFKLLADSLEISGLTMTDNLTAKVQAEVQAQLEAVTPEGQTVFNPGDVYTDSDNVTWVDEDEYAEYVEHKDEVIIESGYLGPDGIVWENEQEYLESITVPDTSTIIVDDGLYQAPDGTVWTSKEQYEQDQASKGGTVVVPVEDGEVVEQGEGFYADGIYWETEADYQDWLKAQREGTAVDTTVTENNNSNNAENAPVIEDNSGLYKDSEGNYWASEEAYLEYISQNPQTTDVASVVVEEEETTEVISPEGLYQDSEGNYWVSEEAYLESLNIEAEKTK